MAESLPVALSVMTAGDIRFETHESIFAAHLGGAVIRHFGILNGPYLDNGRNEMVRTFKDPAVREACTHLLMVDSDISFSPEDVRTIYDACQERAVVGGVYYSNYQGNVKPVVYDWTENSLGMKTLEVIDHWDDGWEFWPNDQKEAGGYTQQVKGLDPLVKVEAMGAGFLMIRYEVIDVLEAIHGEPQPWFDEPVIDGIHFGEDLAFCQRVKDAGFSVWAHRGVEVAHIKTAMIGPQPSYKVAKP